MIVSKSQSLRNGIVAAVLTLVFIFSLACTAEQPAASTPLPTARPAPTATQAATATPTATVAPTPTSPATVTKPAYGGTLRVAIPLGFQTLSPFHGVDYREQLANFAIYNSLVEADENFNIMPSLGQSWDISGDGKAVTFYLQKGVKFQDGTDVNAEAVKWNFDRVLDPQWGANTMRNLFGPNVSKVEAKDPYTVTVYLNRPYRPFLGALSMAYFRIISPTAWEKLGKDGFSRNPVGSGPFKLKDWVVGSSVTLGKNGNYWEPGKPYLDAIKFIDAPDKIIRTALLRTGEADLLDEVEGREVDLLKTSPNVKLVTHESGRWIAIGIDSKKKPWDSLALRQAATYAIDKQKIVDTWLEGKGRVGYTLGVGWYATPPDYKPYQYNLQKAKEKLVEAGYAQGLTVDYQCRSIDVELQLCEMVQSMLGQIGIKTNIVPVIMANWYIEREADRISFGYIGAFPRPDPDVQLRSNLHSSGNYAKKIGLKNPEVDKLLDEAIGIYDTAKAGALYIKAQQLAFDEAKDITLFHPTVYAGLNKKVQNFVWIPDTLVRLRDIWIEK